MKPNAKTTNLAVVVPSLNYQPKYGLMVVHSNQDHTAGDVLEILGRYVSPFDGTETVYIRGRVHRNNRLAVEEEGYDYEYVYNPPLPELIEEIPLDEYPKEFKIVLTNCKLMDWPEPEGRQIAFTPAKETPFPPAGECRVIEHPAKARQQQPAAQLKFPFAEPVNQPTQNAS